VVEFHHDSKLEEKEGEQEEGFPGTEKHTFFRENTDLTKPRKSS
jgi:hypothetical protein